MSADVTAALDLVAGSPVALVAGVVKRACVEGARCECFEAAAASATATGLPDDPIVPLVVVEGVTVAAVCEGLILDASRSTGGGGRGLAGSSSTSPRRTSSARPAPRTPSP